MAETAFSPDFAKLSNFNEWFDNTDISTFLNSDMIMDFSQPSVSQDAIFYPTSSPEQVFCVSESSYSSDGSNTPLASPQDIYYADTTNSGVPSPVDVPLFDLADPLLVPEIEKILGETSYQSDVPSPLEAFVPVQKKRQRDEDVSVPITLSRDQLLVMTSKEIEDYVSTVKSKRSLTVAEEKDLKRQRRLVKNREYASQSRSRKRLFVDVLEKKLEDANAEIAEVKKQNQTLVDENRLLKKQLGCIAETIKKSQLNAGSANGKDSTQSGGILDKFRVGVDKTVKQTTNRFSACLLAIFFMVFTFAAFWENEPKFGPAKFQPGGRHILEWGFESEPGIWDAASEILRQTWESSVEYLPSWDNAYSLFVSSYPLLINTKQSLTSSYSSLSSPSSPVPIPSPVEEIRIQHEPPASLPQRNKTARYKIRSLESEL